MNRFYNWEESDESEYIKRRENISDTRSSWWVATTIQVGLILGAPIDGFGSSILVAIILLSDFCAGGPQ